MIQTKEHCMYYAFVDGWLHSSNYKPLNEKETEELHLQAVKYVNAYSIKEVIK